MLLFSGKLEGGHFDILQFADENGFENIIQAENLKAGKRKRTRKRDSKKRRLRNSRAKSRKETAKEEQMNEESFSIHHIHITNNDINEKVVKGKKKCDITKNFSTFEFNEKVDEEEIQSYKKWKNENVTQEIENVIDAESIKVQKKADGPSKI